MARKFVLLSVVMWCPQTHHVRACCEASSPSGVFRSGDLSGHFCNLTVVRQLDVDLLFAGDGEGQACPGWPP